jgi:hypothetical protein
MKRWGWRGGALVACFVAWGLAPSGCGDEEGDSSGEPAFLGLYVVSSATQADPCDGEAVAEEDAAYLRLAQGDFFGVPSIVGYVCATEEECGEGVEGFGDWTFFEQRGATWVTEANASSYGGTTCVLSYSESVLTIEDNAVHLESNLSTAEVELTEAECEPDAVSSRRDQMACTSRRLLDASR